MAGRIRQEDLEAVRERTDIVQVISGHLQLKKAGRDSLVGLCPFHPEKTPSFSVSPSKQVYYCFGCGEGGNLFRFIEKVEGLSFIEAVERLAQQSGITLRYEGESGAGAKRTAGRRQAMNRAVAETARLYHRMLLDGREAGEARNYLESRGLGKGSVERFGIGYAPGYSDFILKRLSKTYSPELLLEAGLVLKDDAGSFRDRFRSRLMFPIHDLSGNTVGFGGRLLARPGTTSNAPKYVNSPETPIYRKGELLYNLHRAKSDITRVGRAFLVEGYTDVIALDQAGVPGAVATCGTALGEDHIRVLSRFTETAVLAFDSDEAGARAAERAFQFHQRYAVNLSVLVLPEGQDPADFVLASGGDSFLELAAQARPLVEYMIDRALSGRSLEDIEGRVRAARAGVAVILGVEDPVRRDEYVRVVAHKTREPERSVMQMLQQMTEDTGSGGRARQEVARVAPDEDVEREILKLLIQAPTLCAEWIPKLDASRFAKATHRKAFELIVDTLQPNGFPVSPAELVSKAHERGGDQLARLLAAVSVEPLKSAGEPNGNYVERLFLRLEEFSLKRRADVIRKQLERVNPLKMPADHESLFEELVALESARRKIRAAAEGVGTRS
ncbi:MAG: DNA primase [Actinomycetota bacterium]|nr:DNA primase [Actinomycetota bacterium]